MAQYIETTNDITTFSKAEIQTVNRPIILSWRYTGSGPVPRLISVQVEVELNGSFVNAGNQQIVNRTQLSAATNPTFEIDVSSLIKGFIEDNLTDLLKSHPSSGLPLSSIHTSTNSQKNIIRYRAKARSFYLNNENVLVQNLTDGEIINPPSGSLFACNMYIKDGALISSEYANLGLHTSSAASDIAFSVEGTLTSLPRQSFLTNCPESLTRILPLQSHFFLSIFNRSSFQVTVRAFINNDSGTLSESIIGSSMPANDSDIHTYNLTMNNSSFFNETTGTSTAACGEKLTLVLKNSSSSSKGLNFKLVNKKGVSPSLANPNLNTYPIDGSFIVFINDYNVYDYYFFEGFTDITHQQEKYLYKTGYKDYTRRESSKRGISSAKTTEVYTCSTIVNKEGSEFLSEIYRSSKVYLYDVSKHLYIPIIVLDQDVQVKYANKAEVKPFSISFVKDVHVINK